jgi:hypothetical protein
VRTSIVARRPAIARSTIRQVPSLGVPGMPPVEVGGGVTFGLPVTPATSPEGLVDGDEGTPSTDPVGSTGGGTVGGAV